MSKNTFLNYKVLLGMVLLAGLLLCATFVYMLWLNPVILGARTSLPPAAFTIIPAPSSTPRFISPSLIPASPVPPPTSTPVPGSIAFNTYVQISGTGGDGLRLRASPSLVGDPLFLGNESEVFLVTGGPTQADGYTWWYLTAPYDQTRSGWAAANFLVYIPSP